MIAVPIITQADAAVLGQMRLSDALRRKLARALVVGSEAVPSDVATMNSLVRFVDQAAGVAQTAALVYRAPPRHAPDLVAVGTALGTALLGLWAGETEEWILPDGRCGTLRLAEVLFQPERTRRNAA